MTIEEAREILSKKNPLKWYAVTKHAWFSPSGDGTRINFEASILPGNDGKACQTFGDVGESLESVLQKALDSFPVTGEVKTEGIGTEI